MPDNIDFQEFASKISQERDGKLLPVIEKEIFHYEILLAMDKARYLERLTFQGGTCLRLCYGSQRYSEDLDFVGGHDFVLSDMEGLKEVLVKALRQRYELQVDIIEPESSNKEVFSWRIKIVTAPKRADIPQQHISIEVAAIPAHTRSIQPVILNYPDLPSSYANVLMVCETLEEICADKLKAFITAPYIRYRDIWDMRWLSRQPGFNPEILKSLLPLKLDDYGAHELFSDNLARLDDLDKIVHSDQFEKQMKRFLPAGVLTETIERPIFREHLVETIRSLYSLALRNIH